MVFLNRYIADCIDRLALMDLHRKRSKKAHFNNLNIKVNDLKSFYLAPNIPDITFEQQRENDTYRIGRFSYESEVDNGTSNKYSTGLYFENKNLDQTANVIIVHGWRMNNLERVKNIYLNAFSKLGLNMYYFTLPYHLERDSKESLYNGELMVSADIDRTLISIKQAITDLRALIHWLKANRNGKVVLIGVSIGGFITNLVGVVEKEIDALISTFYANSMAYSVWHTIAGKYVKKDFEQSGFKYEQLERVWSIINPSLFKPVVKKEKILLLSGIYDRFVVSEDTDRLWESWDRPQRILYPCGHAGIVLYKRKIEKDTISFFTEKIL
jgi:hypothetical protein